MAGSWDGGGKMCGSVSAWAEKVICKKDGGFGPRPGIGGDLIPAEEARDGTRDWCGWL